jgi:predicted Fe-S protein YdhL (DUF1289 family)
MRRPRAGASRLWRYHVTMSYQFRAVLSPCIGVCILDEDGLCQGCHRSGDEIAAWGAMGDDTRLRYMDVILPARAVRRETG